MSSISVILPTDFVSNSRQVINDNFAALADGSAITSLPAGIIVGPITSGQIGSVNATSIEGTIVASQIGSVNASTITGTITASQIGSVNASTIIGSITSGQIGSVAASTITGSITSGQIGSVDATVIVGTITSSQIASVDATTITGSITFGQIGSVDATTIIGVIVTAQLENQILSSLSLFSNNLRPITIVGTLPTLPDVNYPIGSIVSYTVDGKPYRNIANVWVVSTAASDISGTLTASQIASVNVTSLVGLVTAVQIDTIAATQITGTLNSTQILTVNASSIIGSITSGQIGSVAASTITGSITSGQIGSVAASTITGSITSGQIGSVAASTITGTITSSQIASVAATTITGTIVSTQISSINATTINIGTLSSTQIGSVNANTITLGTLDVARLGAASIDVTKLTIDQIIVVGMTLTDNSPTSGNVAWSACTVYYNGSAYSISSGNTTGGNKFIYWTVGSGTFTQAASYTSGPTIYLIATNNAGTSDVAWNKLAGFSVQENNLSFSLLSGFQLQSSASASFDTNAGIGGLGTLVLINDSHPRGGVLLSFGTASGGGTPSLGSFAFGVSLSITVDGGAPQIINIIDSGAPMGTAVSSGTWSNDAIFYATSISGNVQAGGSSSTYPGGNLNMYFGISYSTSLLVELIQTPGLTGGSSGSPVMLIGVGWATRI